MSENKYSVTMTAFKVDLQGLYNAAPEVLILVGPE